MKYIIELPEEAKEKFDNATKEDIYGCFYDHNSVIGNAIKNGTPLSEELEKIRAEIKEEKIDIDLDIGQERLYNIAINDVMQIIDKHISELKGGAE